MRVREGMAGGVNGSGRFGAHANASVGPAEEGGRHMFSTATVDSDVVAPLDFDTRLRIGHFDALVHPRPRWHEARNVAYRRS